ncbi:MAG TPA: hypothetical protein VN720_01440 [Rudaea sp.]|nr:hypothetical protein [Rudaea sp.]
MGAARDRVQNESGLAEIRQCNIAQLRGSDVEKLAKRGICANKMQSGIEHRHRRHKLLEPEAGVIIVGGRKHCTSLVHCIVTAHPLAMPTALARPSQPELVCR